VVNFLNKSNAADQRVYQLLDEKFKLFNGIFGASDEVLGAIESGVDFEKRIIGIYQRCRTPQQITFEFDQLQQELESEIGEKRTEAREQLLNNFDEEVIERVRIASADLLNRFEAWLWKATLFFLEPFARFEPSGHSFTLLRNPFADEPINPGPYRMGKRVEDANTYRVGHPLAQLILERCKSLDTPPAEVRFDYSGSGKRIALLDGLVGRQGWLMCSRLTIRTFDTEDHILFAAIQENGAPLDAAACKRLFDLPATVGQPVLPVHTPALDEQLRILRGGVLEEIGSRNNRWLDQEVAKLDRWSEDVKLGLEQEIKDLDHQIREAKRASATAATLAEKLTHQRTLKNLQAARNQKRKDLFAAQDEVEARRDGLISNIEGRLKRDEKLESIFSIRWRLE
jgi:hypothetical protein